ncbi:hypothetical protein Pelo_1374 [Pelomyxa schiedti]|nr:hypothetical protein Pelo_1374 [Pelomyxa schiedti]
MQHRVSIYRRLLLAGQHLNRTGYYVDVKAYTYATGHWRCEISPFVFPSQPENPGEDADADKGEHLLMYSSAQRERLFDGVDASSMTPAQIAGAMLGQHAPGGSRMEESRWARPTARVLRWMWWYDCVLEATAPNGVYSEFDDYSGFTVCFGPPDVETERSKLAVSFEEAEGYRTGHGGTVLHPFILDPGTIPGHVASRSAAVYALVKDGRWAQVVEQVRLCPDLVQYPLLPNGADWSLGYCILHYAADAAEGVVPVNCARELVELGASVHKRCADGTPVEIARKRGNTGLLPFFMDKCFQSLNL